MLTNDTKNQTYCVTREGADKKMLLGSIYKPCMDCSAMVQGQPCYEPDMVIAHASFAFDTYYHRMAMADGSCGFNGVAIISTMDPSML